MRMSVRKWRIQAENPVVLVFRCQLVGHTTQCIGVSHHIMKELIIHRLFACAIWANEELVWSGT
jgi:hypothetical protein